MNTHGQVSWDDNNGFDKGEKKVSNKDLFLRLEDGSNIIRIVSPPFQYLTHKGVKCVGDPGYGRKVSCSMVHGSCPLCTAGLRASPRFFLGVLHRKSNTYKVLDVSWSTFQDIKSFSNNKEVWGDVLKYDLDIKKDSKHPSKYYQVSPIPHKPLSAADEKVRDDNMDLADLEYKSTPLSVETVQKIVDGIVKDGELFIPVPKEGEKSWAKPATKTAAKSKAAPVVNMAEGEDDMSDAFPDYGSPAANG